MYYYKSMVYLSVKVCVVSRVPVEWWGEMAGHGQGAHGD